MLKYLLLILLPAALFAQPYIFFYDSPNDLYYDPSFGYYNTPSVVILSNGDKCPVDDDVFVAVESIDEDRWVHFAENVNWEDVKYYAVLEWWPEDYEG